MIHLFRFVECVLFSNTIKEVLLWLIIKYPTSRSVYSFEGKNRLREKKRLKVVYRYWYCWTRAVGIQKFSTQPLKVSYVQWDEELGKFWDETVIKIDGVIYKKGVLWIRIHIDLPVLDPDPYWRMRIRIQEHVCWLKFTNKLGLLNLNVPS
jgi:hypothetical protein